MLVNHTYIGTNNKQNTVFPLEYMYLTQGENGGYSHQGSYAMDFQGMYNASTRRLRCPYYAPVDMTMVAISDSNSHGYVYTSDNEVNFIDGTSGYLTILVAHDNTSYSVGRHVDQGQMLGQTGTYGNVTGDHLHIEAKKGQWEGLVQNSQGVYMLKNSDHIYNLIGVDDTVLLVTGGYNWREFGDEPIPPEPTFKKNNKFPWVLYSRKLRQKFVK